MTRVRAVLLDLDGTLAHTAPDMADALNELLARHGRDGENYDRVRRHTSRGAIALIRLGFSEPMDESGFRVFATNSCRSMRAFCTTRPGFSQVCRTCWIVWTRPDFRGES